MSSKTMSFEEQYSKQIEHCLFNGIKSEDRTGTGTLRVQHAYFDINAADGLPRLIGKRINYKSALVEICWMLAGYTNTQYLKRNGVNYWDEWASEDGSLGPIYGKQMVDFNGVNQIQECINKLRTNPDSRQIIMSLWNPAELAEMKLPPCHAFYQFTSVETRGYRTLHMHVYQRSADSFLGVPYDALLFTFLLQFVAIATKMRVGHIHYTCGDFHIYDNHINQVATYIRNVKADLNGFMSDPLLDTKPTDFVLYKKLVSLLQEEFVNFKSIFKVLEKHNFDYYNDQDYRNYGFIKAKVSV